MKPRDPEFAARPAKPVLVTMATPVSTSTTIGVNREYKIIQRVSREPIFLPRYSGVRPTINPPRKTPSNAAMTMLYTPVPSPPKTTSPNSMQTKAVSTPSGW